MNRRSRPFATGLLLLLASCGVLPEKVSWSDPRLAPMLAAIAAVDRASLGFTPIDRSSIVRLESDPRAGYDAMLHIEGRTSRTVAFRRNAGGYEWIHEQEIHTGPKTYESPDGTLDEQIVVTYERQRISGHEPGKLHVEYWGEDPRLPANQPLTLDQVRPILAEWDRTQGRPAG